MIAIASVSAAGIVAIIGATAAAVCGIIGALFRARKPPP